MGNVIQEAYFVCCGTVFSLGTFSRGLSFEVCCCHFIFLCQAAPDSKLVVRKFSWPVRDHFVGIQIFRLYCNVATLLSSTALK